MKILLAILVSATCVLCHPVSDPEIPSKDVVQKVLKADPAGNDISFKENETVAEEVAITPASINTETKTKTILNDLEKKGEKIFDDMVIKIADSISAKQNETNADDKGEIKTEKPQKTSMMEGMENFTEKQNIDNVGTFDLLNYDYVSDDYMFSNRNPPKPPAIIENPDDTEFDIVPFGIENTDIIPNTPKLNRNVNKLENENKQESKIPGGEKKFVEIPLNVQKANQEDSYLPDIDIKDTIINDPSFNNPILSPVDTLPLNTFPSDSISNQEVQEDQNSEDNFIRDNFNKDSPNDYDRDIYGNQDYMNNYDYDYDFQERNVPVPVRNHMAMMNSHYTNNRQFQHPQNMGNNYPHRPMINPTNEFKNILYSNEPLKTDFITPMQVIRNNQAPKIPYNEVTLLMDQIFPGIFKNSPSPKLEKEITIFIDGYPEFLTKEKNPLVSNAERNPHKNPVKYDNKPEEFIIEIGNIKPMRLNKAQPTAQFEYFPYDSSFQMMPQHSLKSNQFTDNMNTKSFGISPVTEEYTPEKSEANEETIDNITQPNEEFDPEMIDYDYRTYAPQYYHSLYMHPEEYKLRYPNKQYMPRPYNDRFPDPMYHNYMNQQNYLPYRNRVPYHPEPIMEPQINSYNSVPWNNDYSNMRFPTPEQYPMNYNRFTKSHFNPYQFAAY